MKIGWIHNLFSKITGTAAGAPSSKEARTSSNTRERPAAKTFTVDEGHYTSAVDMDWVNSVRGTRHKTGKRMGRRWTQPEMAKHEGCHVDTLMKYIGIWDAAEQVRKAAESEAAQAAARARQAAADAQQAQWQAAQAERKRWEADQAAKAAASMPKPMPWQPPVPVMPAKPVTNHDAAVDYWTAANRSGGIPKHDYIFIVNEADISARGLASGHLLIGFTEWHPSFWDGMFESAMRIWILCDRRKDNRKFLESVCKDVRFQGRAAAAVVEASRISLIPFDRTARLNQINGGWTPHQTGLFETHHKFVGLPQPDSIEFEVLCAPYVEPELPTPWGGGYSGNPNIPESQGRRGTWVDNLSDDERRALYGGGGGDCRPAGSY